MCRRRCGKRGEVKVVGNGSLHGGRKLFGRGGCFGRTPKSVKAHFSTPVESPERHFAELACQISERVSPPRVSL